MISVEANANKNVLVTVLILLFLIIEMTSELPNIANNIMMG
jgi:hypothetical protein